jgi:hypothetical protein
MYDQARTFRTAQRLLESLSTGDGEEVVRLALGRVRKMLTAYLPGMAVSPARLRAALDKPLLNANLEAERSFARGWLRWLEGDAAGADGLFTEALAQARQVVSAPPAPSQGPLAPLPPTELLARCAYWCARVRLLAGKVEAIAEFEPVLRTLGGSPQATAWFVDLLWRAGRTDRAEQVWKSVRGNRRVSSCDEGPLLEARALLRRGEAAPAERLLQEAAPAGGVAWVERRLLLAWALVVLRQGQRALDALAEAERGPYPAAALREWRRLLEARLRGKGPDDLTAVPTFLRDFVRGQQARAAGRDAEAEAAYQSSLNSPVAQPFARAALASLGKDDPAAVLAGQPGLFLAVRCRARIALERFRLRQITPAELLDSLQQAAAAGYRSSPADHFWALAEALQQRQHDSATLNRLTASVDDSAQGRNALRTALELAVRRLPLTEALALLRDWARRLPADASLRQALGQQLLRLALLEQNGRALADAERLLSARPLLMLARAALRGEALPSATNADAPPLLLWRAAHALPSAGEPWRQEVRGLRAEGRLRPVAQALLLQEAAQRADVPAVAALLEEVDAWRGFRLGPPLFVLRALEAVVRANPTHAAWKRALPRWLRLWELSGLGAVGTMLAAHVGLEGAPVDALQAPPDVPAAPWLLHQAARALGRDDARAALSLVQRALAVEGGPPDAEVVRAALPELQRRARAQALAAALGPSEAGRSGLLVDLIELLEEAPEGRQVLGAIEQGSADVGRLLAELAERPNLPPRLAHHLALVEWRLAEGLEEQTRSAEAAGTWQRAWHCWLALLAAPASVGPEQRGTLLTWLLGTHRRRINDWIARDDIDAARRHWALVQGLPDQCQEEELKRELAERVARFREELATEHLLSTREAMRFGAIPEGWRADYETGLRALCRLLALDHDNCRLLTALVEICCDWFLDLYNADARRELCEQIDRYTPLALRLAGLIEERPGELPARAALSELTKFRGFVQGDRGQKVALYREALRFNPGNDNVRSLLAELGEPFDSTAEEGP